MAHDADDLLQHIETTSRLLALSLAPEWVSSVRENFEMTLRLADFVGEFPLPDTIEQSPIFEA